MRSFAEAWPDQQIVKQVVSQIQWEKIEAELMRKGDKS